MKQRLCLYHIDMKYIRNLHHVDDNVPSVSPQIGKEKRTFLGVIVLCNGRKYCVPLSHPTEKHKSMTGRIDFTKVFDGEKMIAALNFNLMIPVENAQLIPVDLRIRKTDNTATAYYKRLCQKEIAWCRKHRDDVVNKANVLYQMYTSGTKFSARRRCLDFPALESACDKYNQVSR